MLTGQPLPYRGTSKASLQLYNHWGFWFSLRAPLLLLFSWKEPAGLEVIRWDVHKQSFPQEARETQKTTTFLCTSVGKFLCKCYNCEVLLCGQQVCNLHSSCRDLKQLTLWGFLWPLKIGAVTDTLWLYVEVILRQNCCKSCFVLLCSLLLLLSASALVANTCCSNESYSSGSWG